MVEKGLPNRSAGQRESGRWGGGGAATECGLVKCSNAASFADGRRHSEDGFEPVDGRRAGGVGPTLRLGAVGERLRHYLSGGSVAVTELLAAAVGAARVQRRVGRQRLRRRADARLPVGGVRRAVAGRVRGGRVVRRRRRRR